MRAYSAMQQQFEAAKNWEQISIREYDVLYALAKAECVLSQKELLNSVLLSQPAVSRLLDRLEKQGLITRSRDPKDGRGILIKLTETGRELQRQVGRTHANTIDKCLSRALDDEQMVVIKSLNDAITQAATVECE